MPQYSDDELIEVSGEGFRRALRHTSYGRDEELDPGWRRETRMNYDFVAGRQWEDKDAKALHDAQRPVLTMNRIDPMVEAVCGVEINNRQELHFDPALPEFGPLADIPNSASKIILSRGNFPREESQAFRNALISGLGPLDHVMDYSKNPNGDLIASAEDPLEYYWPTNACKPGLVDARWIGRLRRMDKDSFEDLFPGQEGSAETFTFIDDPDFKSEFAKLNTYDIYETAPKSAQDSEKQDWSVYQYDYWCMDPLYRVATPAYPQKQQPAGEAQFDEEHFKALKKVMDAAKKPFSENKQYIKSKKRGYYRAYISGGKVLEHELGPCQLCFTTQFITGRWDRNRGLFYGIVRAMRDPAKYSNKFLSTQIDMFNKSIKGGVWYEESALANQNEETIKQDIAKGNAFIKWADGALRNGAVKQIEPTQYPQLAGEQANVINAIPAITGITLEFMGTADRDQPGILEQSRKMASMTILAPAFSALREMRLGSGTIILDYMKRFYSVPRLQKMVGKDLAPLVPQFVQEDELQYEVTVDDAPESPSIKSSAFMFFMQWMQQDPQNASGYVDLFAEYSPLPSKLAQAIAQRFQQRQQPQPGAAQMTGAQIAKVASEAVKNQASAEEHKAKAATLYQGANTKDDKVTTDLLIHGGKGLMEHGSAQILQHKQHRHDMVMNDMDHQQEQAMAEAEQPPASNDQGQGD